MKKHVAKTYLFVRKYFFSGGGGKGGMAVN